MVDGDTPRILCGCDNGDFPTDFDQNPRHSRPFGDVLGEPPFGDTIQIKLRPRWELYLPAAYTYLAPIGQYREVDGICIWHD
jgi:hypothetical protein